MALPYALDGENWTIKTALASLPLLVWCAQHKRTITYGNLNREIVARGLGHHVPPIQYGKPAGMIGEALIETGLEWGKSIPPINAIVVNEKTQLPGVGVDYYLKLPGQSEGSNMALSQNKKRELVLEIHKQIYEYEHWDKILEEYGLKPIKLGIDDEDKDTSKIAQPRRSGWSDEGESQEHKNLKEYIANNPQAVGLPTNTPRGRMEYRFGSADTADVVFGTEELGYLGVEVKSKISNAADLNRGVFQAVKYQALLQAEQRAKLLPPTARAVLVTEKELPLALQNLAEKLSIEVFIVQVN